MTGSVRARRPALALLMLCTPFLAACGSSGSGDDKAGSASGGSSSSSTPLFPDDFKGVCSGATQSRATPYDSTAATHKALWFATYQDGLLDQSTHLPSDWTVMFSANEDALKAIDVVGCAVRSSDKLVKTCDGYQVKGKDTDSKVRMHTATYDVTVHEAATGKVLASTTIAANDGSCPTFESFDSDDETVDEYASIPDDQVAAFMKKWVQP